MPVCQPRPELWRAVPGRNNGKENPRPSSITNTIAVGCCYEAAALLCPKKHSILSVTNQVLLVLSICIFPVCLSSHVYPIQNNLIRRRYGIIDHTDTDTCAVPPDVETQGWGLSLAAASLIRDVQPGHYNTLQYITIHYTL